MGGGGRGEGEAPACSPGEAPVPLVGGEAVMAEDRQERLRRDPRIQELLVAALVEVAIPYLVAQDERDRDDEQEEAA